MFAQVLVAAVAATTLTLAPWSGKDLPTATQAAAKYRLTISGPNATVHLTARRVAAGWLGAFCTSKVCSPMKTSVDVPASGIVTIQFELIREDEHAAKSSGATIASDDGASVSI